MRAGQMTAVLESRHKASQPRPEAKASLFRGFCSRGLKPAATPNGLAAVGARTVGWGLRGAVVNGLRPRVRGHEAYQNQSNEPKGEFYF